MTVLQLNICGAVSKRSDLISLLDNCKKQNMDIDIVILCETFLPDTKNVLFKIPNYNLISRPYKHKKKGSCYPSC